MKRKKYMIVIFLLVIIIVVYIVFSQINSVVSPSSTLLTEDTLAKDLKLLKDENLKVEYTDFFVYKKLPRDSKSRYISGLEPESRIIKVNVTNNWFTEGVAPYEIEHSLRVWLYLQDRKSHFPIIDVWSYYHVRGIVDQNKIARITLIEFEELYEEVHNASDELTNEEMIQELTDLWLEKNPDYPRWWMK